MNDDDTISFMTCSVESINEIKQWCRNIQSLNGKDIRSRPINFWVETDASLQGWGARFENKMTGGRWICSKLSYHIKSIFQN